MSGANASLRASLDTNVVVYAYDLDAGARHDRAVQLIEELENNARIVVSTQVLSEFYWVATRPHKALHLTHDEALQIVQEIIGTWEIVLLTPAVILRALNGVPRHSLAFWDALIWAAACENGIDTVYTEDFQNGRTIEGVTFVNPFADPV